MQQLLQTLDSHKHSTKLYDDKFSKHTGHSFKEDLCVSLDGTSFEVSPKGVGVEAIFSTLIFSKYQTSDLSIKFVLTLPSIR